jgi:hypothetical protein
MGKVIKYMSLAVALLIGVVTAAEVGIATPAATGSPIPSYASPAAQAKVNQKFASQFGIDTTNMWGAGG